MIVDVTFVLPVNFTKEIEIDDDISKDPNRLYCAALKAIAQKPINVNGRDVDARLNANIVSIDLGKRAIVYADVDENLDEEEE